MEDLHLIHFLSYLLAHFVFRPFLVACQALAGLLPSQSSLFRRFFRMIGLFSLLTGVVALLVCFFGPSMEPEVLLGSYAVAFATLFIAGLIGHQLEKQISGSEIVEPTQDV